MIVLCDSVAAANERSKEQLQIQLSVKDEIILNKDLIIEQEQGKFMIAEESLDAMRRRKNIFLTTTVVAVATTILVLTLK